MYSSFQNEINSSRRFSTLCRSRFGARARDSRETPSRFFFSFQSFPPVIPPRNSIATEWRESIDRLSKHSGNFHCPTPSSRYTPCIECSTHRGLHTNGPVGGEHQHSPIYGVIFLPFELDISIYSPSYTAIYLCGRMWACVTLFIQIYK